MICDARWGRAIGRDVQLCSAHPVRRASFAYRLSLDPVGAIAEGAAAAGVLFGAA